MSRSSGSRPLSPLARSKGAVEVRLRECNPQLLRDRYHELLEQTLRVDTQGTSKDYEQGGAWVRDALTSSYHTQWSRPCPRGAKVTTEQRRLDPCASTSA